MFSQSFFLSMNMKRKRISSQHSELNFHMNKYWTLIFEWIRHTRTQIKSFQSLVRSNFLWNYDKNIFHFRNIRCRTLIALLKTGDADFWLLFLSASTTNTRRCKCHNSALASLQWTIDMIRIRDSPEKEKKNSSVLLTKSTIKPNNRRQSYISLDQSSNSQLQRQT